MPDLEALDQFKELVNSLGDEPRILAERGETIEDVPRPEQGLPDDLNDLLGDTGDLEESGDAGGGELDELLAGFGDQEGTPEEEGEPGDQPFEDFDFSADMDDLDSLGTLADDDDTEPEAADLSGPAEEEEPAGPEEPEDLEEPEEDVDDELDLDALIAETSPGSAEEASPAGPEAPSEEGDLEFEEGMMEIGGDDALFEDGPVDIDEDLADIDEELVDTDEELTDIGDEIDEDAADIGEELTDFGEDVEAGDDLAEPEEEDEFDLPDLDEDVLGGEDLDDDFSLDIDSDLGELGDLDESVGDDEPAEPEDEFGDLGDLDAGEEPPVDDEFGEVEAPGGGPPGEEEFPDEFGIDLDSPMDDEEAGEFPFDEEAPGDEAEEFDLGGGGDIELDDVPSADDFSLPDEEGEADDDFEVDQFDLGDLSEDFDLGEEDTAEPGIGQLPEVGDLEEVGEEEFELSDEEFLNIRKTLGSLPRNLKMIIEELIGEKGLGGDQLKTLLDSLSSGKSPKAIAAETSKITGKKIEIPDSYEKKTGAEFESEQESFAYIFKTKIFPIVKVGLAVLVVLGFLGFLGYRYVYTPLYANSLYRKGYESLQAEEYVPAGEQFARAYDVRPKKDWFYTYAEGYIDQKQYSRAEEMYDWLLRDYEGDVKGLMDYAALESNILSNYPKAEDLLQQVLDEDMYHFDALMASGDNYLMWAVDDDTKYEDARHAYALLLQRYGGRPDVLQRMLRYFIRTDNYEEVDRLATQFQADPNMVVDPHVFAELGGYMIDNNRLAEVKDILFRAMDADRNIPEVHYHLARYYRELEDYSEEEKALRNALRLLREATPFTTDRLGKLIDSHNRLGESHYRKREYLLAEQSLQEGIKLYEDAVERKLIGPADRFGKLYANLGDIYYYISGNLDTAFDLYDKAERNLHSTRDIDFKQGYILYRREDYRDSLQSFYQAAGAFSDNKNLMYATANNLYHRGEYFAAQGYYNHLLDILELQQETIPYLLIEERDDHRSIVEYLMKVYNNLGVTLNRLSEQSADPSKYSRSLAYLTRSTEYADMLTRDFATMERAEVMNLAYLNMRSIMYPGAENELQIYTTIPVDMEDLLF